MQLIDLRHQVFNYKIAATQPNLTSLCMNREGFWHGAGLGKVLAIVTREIERR